MDSGVDGLRVDREGRLYAATRMGIQICDPIGRVQAIIPTPNGLVANLVFGGENFDILYAMARDKVYRRKVKVQGALSYMPPIKLRPPRL
jgi:sugar lactone lactonase YvrE